MDAIIPGAILLVFVTLAVHSLRWGAPIVGSPGSKEEELARAGLAWDRLDSARRGALHLVERKLAAQPDLTDVA